MENNNPSSVGGEGVNAPAPGTENVVSSSLKDVVKNLTGRDYPTDEAAAEGIKNTYSMVGKKVEPQIVEKPIVPEEVVKVVQSLAQDVQNFKAQEWYNQNPQYKDFKGLIDMTGKTPSEVIKSPEFTKIYEAATAGQSKSSLSSNSRIAMPISEDRAADLTAMRKGDMTVAEFMAKYKGVPMPTD